MKYFLILICFLLTSILSAADNSCLQKDKNKPIDIYSKGKYVDSITIETWEAAWQMLDNYTKLKAIEDTLIKENKKVGKIEVDLQDSLWNIVDNQKFTTVATVKWIDGNGKILKSLKIKIEINKVTDPNATLCAKILEVYTPFAQVGCIVFGISTLLLLLL